MKDRSVGVVITSFNQVRWLKEAIRSVMRQSATPDQVVVVDDASTDGSQGLIESYSRKYPRVMDPVLLPRNLGVGRVRAIGLARLRTRYATYLDGDDVFFPWKLERELKGLLRTGAQLAYSDHVTFDSEPSTGTSWAEGAQLPVGWVFPDVVARRFPARSLFKMELVELAAWRRLGFHRPTLTLYEDFDMRIRLTHQLQVTYVAEVLSGVRIHGTGLSSRPLAEHVAQIDRVLRYARPLIRTLSRAERESVLLDVRRWRSDMLQAAVYQAMRGERQLAPNQKLSLMFRATTDSQVRKHVLAKVGGRIRKVLPK